MDIYIGDICKCMWVTYIYVHMYIYEEKGIRNLMCIYVTFVFVYMLYMYIYIKLRNPVSFPDQGRPRNEGGFPSMHIYTYR